MILFVFDILSGPPSGGWEGWKLFFFFAFNLVAWLFFPIDNFLKFSRDQTFSCAFPLIYASFI